MVVSESQRFLHEGGGGGDGAPLHMREDEDTRPTPARRKRAEQTISADGLESLSHDSAGDELADLGGEVPAALSASGVFRPLPGVHRNVTGFFFPELEELKKLGQQTSSRLWYVAIGDRPRGPFAAAEVISLAEKGKVRDSTLVWRPGFGSWKRVKSGVAGSAEDLSWLHNVVQQRKVREREAQLEAERRLGIRPVHLSRSSAGRGGPRYQGGDGMPPPLPPMALDEAFADEPYGVLPLSQLLEDRPAPLQSGAFTPGTFEWRAATPSTRGVRHTLGPLVAALAGAVVVGMVAGLVVAAMGAPWARLVASLALE